ncbi:MAG: hypothetical protein ISR88_07055 [Candidatus Marinimicrobia bacterium]|nr:hypothetical protein [Candidatus Neomarinimicrobiota bacterium]MBL7122528.1 hypothetical protein [Candidatus Neomarinimicrobiota bacterium]
MIFTIFSFTGVAVLNVSYLSSSNSMETINNIKLQYATESSINEALWRINTGVDSLVNSEVDGVITTWDATLNILSVNVDKFQMESEILLDLSEDTHFDRALASDETINTNGNDVDADEENQSRFFSFMPEVDLDYFTDNAVATHTQSWYQWNDLDTEDFGGEGIHIFTGWFIELKNCTFENSTLVFTGKYINFEHQNIINAPAPIDSADAMPALVFTRSDSYFEIEAEGKNYDREDKINGAIYTAGTIVLKKGELSGPIVGKTITMEHGEEYDNQIDFKDTEHPHHYRWTKGFNHKKNYDWPKQIGRWKTKKWGKKNA